MGLMGLKRIQVPEPVGHYLARATMYRHAMNTGKGTFGICAEMPDPPFDPKGEDPDKLFAKLVLVVPGLKVVDRQELGRRNQPMAVCTWSHEAMWARFEELVAKYGVADERLDYMKCEGKVYTDPQNTLPGMPTPEPVTSHFGLGGFSRWLPGGLARIEQGFCNRICSPNRGGPDYRPFRRRTALNGKWWLVGSKGDSYDVMEVEIHASPLAGRVKQNLLFNLKNHRVKR